MKNRSVFAILLIALAMLAFSIGSVMAQNMGLDTLSDAELAELMQAVTQKLESYEELPAAAEPTPTDAPQSIPDVSQIEDEEQLRALMALIMQMLGESEADAAPTYTPTAVPTNTPTTAPTYTPTAVPTNTPTTAPTYTPTAVPTNTPTAVPTYTPTAVPTFTPVPTDTPQAVPDVSQIDDEEQLRALMAEIMQRLNGSETQAAEETPEPEIPEIPTLEPTSEAVRFEIYEIKKLTRNRLPDQLFIPKDDGKGNKDKDQNKNGDDDGGHDFDYECGPGCFMSCAFGVCGCVCG